MMSIVGVTEPSPFLILNGDSERPLLVLCDHASRRVPLSLGRLEIAEEADLSRHIAWDIGAQAVTERLAARSGACAILCGYSRLVIDCNRPLWSPTLVPAMSDGTAVPANSGLSWQDIARRVEGIYLPYHLAIAETLGRFAARGIQPLVLFIHSFTPRMNGFDRPWSIGIPHTADRSISDPFVAIMRAIGGFEAADDQPYSFDDDYSDDYTIVAHALSRGLKHLFIEIRQDEIADPAGAELWGDRIFDALEELSAGERPGSKSARIRNPMGARQ